MAARRAGRKPKLSFSEACAQYWAGRRDVSEDYRSNATRGIERHLNPFIGKMDISTVSRDDLLAALRRMDAKGKFVYVPNLQLLWTAFLIKLDGRYSGRFVVAQLVHRLQAAILMEQPANIEKR
jgi:hypothetical protein